MKRLKLLTGLTATAIAMAGLIATNATADVTVNGHSGEALEGHMDLDAPGDPYPWYRSCFVDLTMEFEEDGAIEVTNVDAYGWDLQDYNCYESPTYRNDSEFLDDCDDAGGWTGQILGPGDEWDAPSPDDTPIEYAGTGDFEAVIMGCINYQSYEYATFRFAIDTDYEHTSGETWSQPEHSMVLQYPTATGFTISGTGWDDPGNATDLALESVE